MLSDELLKKVKLLEIVTRRRVEDLMSGGYKSHFKGHGVQFSEHRLYVPGDDVRHIDWKVTARTRDPLIKKFEEERELTVLLVIDVSGSQGFGSVEKMKSEVVAEISGMLAYAATHTGDKIGVILCSDRVEKIIPPKKGRQHVLRILRDLLTFQAVSKGTDLSLAFETAHRILKHTGVIFILSDFRSKGYEKSLKKLASEHDVVAIRVGDLREEKIPEVGKVLMQDLETGREHYVDTGSSVFKKWFQEAQTQFEKERASAIKGKRIDYLKILSEENYGDSVVRFFRARARQRH